MSAASSLAVRHGTKLRFLLVGGYNTFVGYLLFAVAYWLWGDYLHYAAILAVAHFQAVSHAFLTQRLWVFRSRAPWPGEFLRFHLAYLALLPVGIVLLFLFHDLAGLPVLPAQACALAVSVCLSYLASSRFAFRPR